MSKLKYVVAYKAIDNAQIDVHGIFSSKIQARIWADCQSWKYPQNVQIVTLQEVR